MPRARRRGTSLEGAVAVVTGAAGQIGRRLLADLESRGAVAVGLDLPAACPDGDPRFVPCDVTDDDAVRAAFAEVGRRHPAGVDLLVLAAGISAIGRLGDHDLATHRRVMDVTHFGAVSCLLAALPALRTARGRVVLIGSVAAFAPVLGRPPYVAAKHAVTGLFTAVRPELVDDGVTLTLCHPTFVTGGMAEAAARAPGAERSTSGEELTPADVSVALLDGVERGDDLVLVGRTARLSWWVSRHAPGLYTRMMLRRLRPAAGDPRPTGPADPRDPARPGGAA